MSEQNLITHEDAKRLKVLIDERKVICMRKPPWTCPVCRTETISQFVWQEAYQTFEATCSVCGNQVFG